MKIVTRPNPFIPIVLTVVILAAAIPGHAAEKYEITLTDGKEIEGLVVPLSDCSFLIQTDDTTLEVPAGLIEKVDGDADLTPLLRSGRKAVLRDEVFERILENGDVILQSTRARMHRGSTIVDHLSWGIGSHEEALIPEWKVFDPYGNELTMTVEAPDENGRRQARATLIRPVLPGEELRSSNRLVYHDRIRRNENSHLYRHNGNYPEDRLVTKMILLPPGATVTRATPEPLHSFDLNGAPCMVWRRFFAEGEIYPIEVEYELGD